MNKLEEFKKRRRSWFMELSFEALSLLLFFITYFTHGNTNDLIFWAVLFLWARADAERAYNKIMELKS